MATLRRLPLFLVGILVVSGACENVPLAPSAITLSADRTTVDSNGTVTITAFVSEAFGSAVPNGMLVTFTTNLGIITPSQVETKNGKATAAFSGNGQSGEAQIQASSAGVTTSPLKILVGAAAVGRLSVTADPSKIGRAHV